MRIRVIKETEQRYEMTKRQMHRTAPGGTFSEY